MNRWPRSKGASGANPETYAEPVRPVKSVWRYSAFTTNPDGGNPAGVVLDASELDAAGMLAIAADVGYSETAFVTPRHGNSGREFDVRYFSPEVEIPFCGHATIAAAVALAERIGPAPMRFHTLAGEVPIATALRDGQIIATLTSVAPAVLEIDEQDVDHALVALRWSREDLDPELPARIAYAGARHLILAARTRTRLANLDYDFEALRAFMTARELITVDLVWREDEWTYHSRNAFPIGGVVEDPATGAAAAALGAYLRELGLITPPTTIIVHQGSVMGRPSVIEVHVDDRRREISVSGTAVPITV